MEKTFNITTFGCQMNEHDSEIMAGMLADMGYTEKSEKKRRERRNNQHVQRPGQRGQAFFRDARPAEAEEGK